MFFDIEYALIAKGHIATCNVKQIYQSCITQRISVPKSQANLHFCNACEFSDGILASIIHILLNLVIMNQISSSGINQTPL